MLRIHFTATDLVRTKIADGPDPLWETVLSLQMLRARYHRVIFDGWRLHVREALHQRQLTDVVNGLLTPLTPNASYFPDFLTPPEGLLGLDAGIEAIRATPGRRIRDEIQRLAVNNRLPSQISRLGQGDREVLTELCRALVNYYGTALAPYWDRMRSGADVDTAQRSLRQRTSGSHALLSGFWPLMRWRPPVLEVPYPMSRDLHLNGRGLVLIPSFFCWSHPIAFADPGLPPTLIYPLRPTSNLLDLHPATTAGPALAALIGPTRARILGAVAQGATTSELARRAGVSVTMASQHARILRDAGLINRRRHGNTVLHTLTTLGGAVLGREDPSNKRNTGVGRHRIISRNS